MAGEQRTTLSAQWFRAIGVDELSEVGGGRGGTLAFGFPEESGDIEPEEIEVFLDRLSKLFREQEHDGGRFYAWFDEMAFQLRCSVVAGDAEPLPFAGAIQVWDSPSPVAQHVVRGLRRNAMSYEELVADMAEDEGQLPVFVVPLAGVMQTPVKPTVQV